jgi:hypothetical protein
MRDHRTAEKLQEFYEKNTLVKVRFTVAGKTSYALGTIMPALQCLTAAEGLVKIPLHWTLMSDSTELTFYEVQAQVLSETAKTKDGKEIPIILVW